MRSIPEMWKRRTVEEVFTCAERVIAMTLPSKGEGMVNDIHENQQQDMLIYQGGRSKDRAAVSLFKEERRRKRQRIACPGLQKDRARKAKDASSDMTQQRKVREKER